MYMYINDKYSADVIMSIVNNSGKVNCTPNDYCCEYEDTHSITLADLHELLEDIFKKGGDVK